ncbi:hypothetical protein PRIPAC_78052 [Pristionchus pacificus]|uniref:Uncharacterized protein n=1 Tax=Pristionchus pacificus TaxID=54126 RepID=A0A2A6CQ90_PRIPA|nr:hypothetical protein PRIPAC_78052 [Pristionchus pacificus]|eukprot:PDM80266.1 hypothetical protein PRIPAC_32845 [Pristionchus pacificus]
MSNWSRNLQMTLSEWHFEASCCREAIVSMRVVEVANLITTAFASLIYVRILSTTEILHVNLRLLFSVSVLNDLFLLSIRVFDIVNVSGLLDENYILSFFKYNIVIIFTIVCERIYSVRTYQTYDEVCVRTVQKRKKVRRAAIPFRQYASQSFSVFIFSMRYTSKHAKQIMETRYRLMNNNIASRYQMLQAERSSHMLNLYIPFQALMNIFTITLAISSILFIRARTPQYFLVSIEALYICIGPRVIGACFIAIKRHPALRKEFRLFLAKIRGHRSAAETATTITVGDSNVVHITVQSATGTQLNFTPDREQEIYFKVDSVPVTAPNSVFMLLGDNRNWTASLAVPMSEWHYEASCCRDAIISLRLIETLNIFITTAAAALSFRILKTTKILHINLHLLIITSVLNDLSLSYIRIFDIAFMSIVMIMAGMATRAIILMRYPRYFLFSLQILYSFVGFRVSANISQSHLKNITQASTSMIVLFLRHPTLRRELLRIFKELESKSTHATVLSSHGAPLNFTSDQEKAIVWQTLNWKLHLTA